MSERCPKGLPDLPAVNPFVFGMRLGLNGDCIVCFRALPPWRKAECDGCGGREGCKRCFYHHISDDRYLCEECGPDDPGRRRITLEEDGLFTDDRCAICGEEFEENGWKEAECSACENKVHCLLECDCCARDCCDDCSTVFTKWSGEPTYCEYCEVRCVDSETVASPAILHPWDVPHQVPRWIVSPSSCEHGPDLERIDGILLPIEVSDSVPTVSLFEDPRGIGGRFAVRALDADFVRPCALVCVTCRECRSSYKSHGVWARAVSTADEPWEEDAQDGKFVVHLNKDEWYDPSESDAYELALTSEGDLSEEESGHEFS